MDKHICPKDNSEVYRRIQTAPKSLSNGYSLIGKFAPNLPRSENTWYFGSVKAKYP